MLHACVCGERQAAAAIRQGADPVCLVGVLLLFQAGGCKAIVCLGSARLFDCVEGSAELLLLGAL